MDSSWGGSGGRGRAKHAACPLWAPVGLRYARGRTRPVGLAVGRLSLVNPAGADTKIIFDQPVQCEKACGDGLATGLEPLLGGPEVGLLETRGWLLDQHPPEPAVVPFTDVDHNAARCGRSRRFEDMNFSLIDRASRRHRTGRAPKATPTGAGKLSALK